MKKIYSICILMLGIAVSCNKETVPATTSDKTCGETIISATLGNGVASKTELGDKTDKTYKVFWTEDDAICVNGVASTSIDVGDPADNAAFTIGGAVDVPYCAVYPASACVDGSYLPAADGEEAAPATCKVTLPAVQNYTEGTFDPAAALMIGYSESVGGVSFQNVMAYIKLTVDGGDDTDNIRKVFFQSRARVAVCGEFDVTFADGASALVTNDNTIDSKLTLDCGESGVAQGTEIIIAVPAREYNSGVSFIIVDVNNHYMVANSISTLSLEAGKMYPTTIAFTAEGTYINGGIYTASDYRNFVAAATKNGDYSAWTEEGTKPGTVNLMSDIYSSADFPAVEKGDGEGFDGVFEGNGHTITRDGCSNPLFNYLAAGATIRNLKLAGTRSKLNNWGTCNLVIYNYGTIDHVESMVETTITDVSESVYMGNIVTRNGGTITYCKNSGNTSISMAFSGNYYLQGGGIACHTSYNGFPGTFDHCENTGDITASVTYTAKDSYVSHLDIGGIAGRLNDGTETNYTVISNCSNSGTIKVYETSTNKRSYGCSYAVGGILGSDGIYNTSSNSGYYLSPTSAGYYARIENCTNSGAVEISSANKAAYQANPTVRGHAAAGIAGYVYGTASSNAVVSGCTNTGDIRCGENSNTGEKFSLAAGIVGVGAYATIENCTSTAVMSMSTSGIDKTFDIAGGIAGYFSRGGQIKDCTATMTITDGVTPLIGSGFAGAGVITKYILTISGTNTYNGVPVDSENVAATESGFATGTIKFE